MLKKYKQLFAGIILGAVIFNVAPAMALSGLKAINVMYNNIKIAVDGKEVKTDAEPFIYEGRTYVPIRTVSEALGAEVSWNDGTKTVEIKGNTSLIESLKSENEQLKINLEVKQVILDGSIQKLKEYESLLTTNSVNINNDEKIKKEKSIKEPYDIDTLIKYLNENKNSLKTPMGNMTFEFEYMENDSVALPFDYWIMTDWYGVSPYDIKNSIKYTEKEKSETKQLLREFQEDVANIAFKTLPRKKIRGGFYTGFYTYPILRVDYGKTEFLTWVNYDYDLVYRNNYNDTKLTKFHWYPNSDSYDFTTN